MTASPSRIGQGPPLPPDVRQGAARHSGGASKGQSLPEAVLSKFGDFAIPVVVLGIVLAMITPLPPFLLDILITLNITVSTVVLLVSMYITRPVEFSVFPTALLLMTLFRLALNVSSSRLILLNGNSGTSAAGDVIEAFG